MASNINSVYSGYSGGSQDDFNDGDFESIAQRAKKLGVSESEYRKFEQLAGNEGVSVDDYKATNDKIKENFNSLLNNQNSEFNKYILEMAKRQHDEEDRVDKNVG